MTLKHFALVVSWVLTIKTRAIVCAYNSMPAPARLAALLDAEMSGMRKDPKPILLPCAYDGLSARLIQQAGFEATFMTGFGVSGVRGYPDTQLVSFKEMVDSATMVAEGLSSAALEMTDQAPIPCIADGDTGYGNSINVKRTIFGYGRAGIAGVMIEDQVAPKRCGHVAGKAVVGFDEAVTRIKAACDARDEYSAQFGEGSGPLILARTDALKTDGFDEAIRRCNIFREVGADITFLEAPLNLQQMQEYCSAVSGPKLANMLEGGSTPILDPIQLKQIGYTLAAYPLTLLSASIKAMQKSLDLIKTGESTLDEILTFEQTKDAVGFSYYADQEQRYKID